jgi:cytochrome oxidase Cu insertion factor (SCO1/SenC/PrrC family)
MKAKLSPRAALVIIAAVFILPLVAAWLMYTGVIGFRPGSTRNLGQLVEPPRPITWEGARPGGARTFTTDEFAGHWLVVHAVASPCEDACMEAITGLRQVHRAAGRNQSRIRLAVLHGGGEGERLQRVYDAFYLLESPGGELWRTLESVAAGAQPPARAPGGSYLVDPLGNIMMFYAPGSDPNDLSRDLKRLLTWSKLDEQR